MKLEEILHEGNWNYPKNMKGKDKPNSGANRAQRKAFRKQQKAAAHKERMRGDSGANLKENKDMKSPEEVGAAFKALSTDDYQKRGGRYPKSNVPDTIQGGVWSGSAEIEFSFKSTSEDVAKRWVERFIKQNRLPFTKIEAGQDGDYHDDWVTVWVTYKGN